MKNISELTDFYYKTLYPVLQELENKREKLKKKIINIGIVYTVIILLFAFALLKNIQNIEAWIFAAVVYLAVGGGIYKYLIKDYTAQFKSLIIEPLIQEIDKNLTYLPNAHIAQESFTRSKIFTARPDKFSGNDYIRGAIDGIKIELSDIHAQKKHKDSKGRTSWSTIFQGLFIVCEFNKHFASQTVILPDSAQNTFGTLIGNWLQANNMSRSGLVKMDNVAFEKEFVVYSNDQIEARYILTHTLMSKLLHLKKKSKHPFYVSFLGGNIYMAIEYNKDLFEPSVFHSLLKYKIAMQYIQTLHLALGIVGELQLNQKLWSKR
ncbi:DUF3137 domain-containing protein [Sulfurimonas sp. NWX367]|uniref:DUF3137 domain-containing protein n=1 Tax=Sulfurimonas sp. NWX367 TaxID=2925413 RepID=UPI003204EACF